MHRAHATSGGLFAFEFCVINKLLCLKLITTKSKQPPHPEQ